MVGSVYNISRQCGGILLQVRRDCNECRLDEVSCNEMAWICRSFYVGPDSEQGHRFC